MLFDIVKLAVSNLTHRKMRSWLTMIGIFIGIAAVVALISLAQGLRDAITGQFASFGTDKVIIQGKGGTYGPPGANAVGNVSTDDVKLIEGVQGVKLATGRLIRTAQLETQKKLKYPYLGSVPEDSRERQLVLEASKYTMDEGDFIEPGQLTQAVIGYSIAHDDLDRPIRVGETVKVNGKNFQVVGILKKRGLPPYDQVVLMNEKPMRTLLSVDKAYDTLVAQANPGENLEDVALRIEKAMRQDRRQKIGEEDFTIQTPMQALQTVNTILVVVSVIVVGIAGISLIVGGIGIMNTMYTAVLERTKEIGIMKSIGAQNKDIFVIFLVESGLLGTVGGLIGIIIGIAMAKAVEGIAFIAFGPGLIQASISAWLLLGALLFSFIVGSLSGLTPAYQASRLKPADAVRYE